MTRILCRIIPVMLAIALFAPSGMPADNQYKYITEPIERSKYLQRSGVAHDAYEALTGMIKILDPRNFFSPGASQVTWWGEFKSFNTWGRPQLHARWFNPEGMMVASQDFVGEECRLAKVTLEVRERNIELKEGRWMVEVSMDGKPIDRKNFVVFDPNRPPAAPPQPSADVVIDQGGGAYGGGG